MHVLIVEDNPELAVNIGQFLEDRTHVVDFAADGRVGLRLAIGSTYDAIVLDLMLPALDGLELCRKLRSEHQKLTPVLMLTARDTLPDRLRGFSVGADDYLVKPFSLLELEARLLALVRRTDHRRSERILRVADLQYDLNTLTVTRGGQLVALKPMALRILALLMRASPRVVTRAEIEREIWADNLPDDDVLRAHIHAIRSAIDKLYPVKLLHTLHGIGFRLYQKP